MIPAAAVAVKNTATQAERALTTNEAGIFVAQFLQPGAYEITVTKAGIHQDGAHRPDAAGGTVPDGELRSAGAEFHRNRDGGCRRRHRGHREDRDVAGGLADAEGESADRRPALGRLRAADAQHHHRWRHRPGLLPRHFRPLQPERGGWNQQHPGVLLRNQGPDHARLRVQHGFGAGVSGGREQLQRGVGPGGRRRGQRGHQIRHQRDSRRPLLLPALPHAERARPAAEIARHLHPADSPAAAVRRQRRRAHRQGQALLLPDLRGFAQGEPDQLHQHFLQRAAALPGGDSGRHLRRCQRLRRRATRRIPALHPAGRRVCEDGLSVHPGKPRERFAQRPEFQSAELLPDRLPRRTTRRSAPTARR